MLPVPVSAPDRLAVLEAAWRLADADDLPGATARFRELVARWPGDPCPLAGLGACLLWSGERAAGVRLLREALRLNPEHPTARRVLCRHFGSPVPPSDAVLEGIAALEGGDCATASVVARQVLADAPDDVPALRLLGHSLRRRGRPGEAAVYLERVTQLAPDARDIRALADCLQASGRPEAAAAVLARLSPPPASVQAVAVSGDGVTEPVWLSGPVDFLRLGGYVVGNNT